MSVVHVNSISGITSITTPSSSDVLTLHTSNNAEKVRITSTGQLLLGINNAVASDVNFQIHSASSGVGPILNMTNDTGDCRIFFGQDNNSGSANGKGQIRYNIASNYLSAHTAGDERFRITSAGSVGIGTVTPTFASGSGLHLHVTDVPRFRITNSVTGTASTQGTDIRMESSDLIIQNKESANMRFYAGGTENLRITSDGDIVTQGLTGTSFDNDSSNTKILEITGDGTVGEYGQLNLSGNQNADAGTLGIIKFINRENSSSSSGSNAGSKQLGSIEMRSETGDSNGGDDSGGYLRFVTKSDGGGNAERMRITGIGSVGINEASPLAMLDIGGAYNKHGLKVTSGATGYNDPLIIRRSTGGDTFRVQGNGAVLSESSMFNHYNHLVCQGGSGGSAHVNYILVCKTNTNDARLSGHFVITRQAGASGIAISKIEANLCGNNSAGDFRYQTRSMSTRGSYPGMEGRWVTLTYGGNNYYAIRIDPATDSSRWASQPQHCYFTGTENNCVGNGLGTIIDSNANTITSITELDDINGTTVSRNSYNYIKEGYLSVQGGIGQGAMQVIPYELNGSNGSQPITLTVKAQKNACLELNRFYSHGEILQFRHNNDAVGYFTVNGSSSSHVSSGSDIRLKKDIEDWTEEVLPYFKSLKPQKFRFNIEDETVEKTKGYMAQDNLDKFPEAYPLNPEDDRYWFTPQHMVPYLMKALQEEIGKREEIEAKYNALEARIAALESS